MTKERAIGAFKYLYDRFKDYNDKEIESWGIIDECITEWIEFKDKNHKYSWHDLRKNPKDLPEKSGENAREFEVVLKRKYNDFKYYSHARRLRLSDDKVYWCDTNYGYLNHPKYVQGKGGDETLDVIAWREIEPFESEEAK